MLARCVGGPLSSPPDAVRGQFTRLACCYCNHPSDGWVFLAADLGGNVYRFVACRSVSAIRDVLDLSFARVGVIYLSVRFVSVQQAVVVDAARPPPHLNQDGRTSAPAPHHTSWRVAHNPARSQFFSHGDSEPKSKKAKVAADAQFPAGYDIVRKDGDNRFFSYSKGFNRRLTRSPPPPSPAIAATNHQHPPRAVASPGPSPPSRRRFHTPPGGWAPISRSCTSSTRQRARVPPSRRPRRSTAPAPCASSLARTATRHVPSYHPCAITPPAYRRVTPCRTSSSTRTPRRSCR